MRSATGSGRSEGVPLTLYASLAADGASRLDGLRWPRARGTHPGGWVEAPPPPRGFPLEQLPWWLDDELWEVELAPPLVPEPRCVRGTRGRLLRRIEAWTDAVAAELVRACESRVRAASAAASGGEAELLGAFADDVLLYAADADRPASAAAVAAYISAHALAGGEKGVRGYESRFVAERRWQVEWLREHLRL